jgi:RNA polymerase sigma-70 factor (ECF subfamily)
LRDPDAFAPWLASIARNLARDWHKQRRESSSSPEWLDEQRASNRELDDALTILSVIHALPERDRELLVLRFVEGLDGREIAAALGMTAGSVRVKLHRATTLLRERMQTNGGGA